MVFWLLLISQLEVIVHVVQSAHRGYFGGVTYGRR